ncbi:hypothetical protein ES708_32728 [subsurface metagenome]
MIKNRFAWQILRRQLHNKIKAKNSSDPVLFLTFPGCCYPALRFLMDCTKEQGFLSLLFPVRRATERGGQGREEKPIF